MIYAIIEALSYFLLIFGVFLVQWGFRHKSISLAILAVLLVIVDVIVLLRVTGKM